MSIQKPVVGSDFNLKLFLKKSDEPYSVAAATSRKIHVIRPGSSKLFVDASLITDGKDGGVMYHVTGAENSVAGAWSTMCELTWADGSITKTIIKYFRVYPSL